MSSRFPFLAKTGGFWMDFGRILYRIFGRWILDGFCVGFSTDVVNFRVGFFVSDFSAPDFVFQIDLLSNSKKTLPQGNPPSRWIFGFLIFDIHRESALR